MGPGPQRTRREHAPRNLVHLAIHGGVQFPVRHSPQIGTVPFGEEISPFMQLRMGGELGPDVNMMSAVALGTYDRRVAREFIGRVWCPT